MLKVKATAPCLIIDIEGHIVDLAVTKDARSAKIVEVPDTEFWRSRIVKGQLQEVQSKKKGDADEQAEPVYIS